jgi:tRNA-uridine 2-sulfurtransferase
VIRDSNGKRLVVAMSGGVDSSVAALLLKEQGYEPIGVSLQVWDYRRNGGCQSRAACCAPSDFSDARRVAAALDIPYYVFDFEEVFEAKVIAPFMKAYASGLTPNPCIDCNTRVKFGELRERAESLRAWGVATGHYASIECRPDGFHLLRGSDEQKDQSYFLYEMTQLELSRTIFPVGAMTKSQVRQLARRIGLVTADKEESQDICFVSGSVAEFLEREGHRARRGEIVDKNGRKLGEHSGIHQFTVGQRRGIGVGGFEAPLYVLELDAESNRVIVGQKEDLEKTEFSVGDLSWCAPGVLEELKKSGVIECLAQLRYRHKGAKVQMRLQEVDRVIVKFLSEWATVSPGQAAVFYDLSNREVLGGGRIRPF